MGCSDSRVIYALTGLPQAVTGRHPRDRALSNPTVASHLLSSRSPSGQHRADTVALHVRSTPQLLEELDVREPTSTLGGPLSLRKSGRVPTALNPYDIVHHDPGSSHGTLTLAVTISNPVLVVWEAVQVIFIHYETRRVLSRAPFIFPWSDSLSWGRCYRFPFPPLLGLSESLGLREKRGTMFASPPPLEQTKISKCAVYSSRPCFTTNDHLLGT